MIIFRYLFWEYLKVLLFCLGSLLAIFFTTRLDLIAKFATLGASGKTLLTFVSYQLTYLLPIILPIGALLSTILLFQRLSKQNELTALRAGGWSLGRVLAPVLITASFLSLFNFYLVSEIATQSHLATRLLDHELHAINPLSLLRNKQVFFLHDLFVDVRGKENSNDQLQNVVIAHWDKKIGRLQLLTVNTLTRKDSSLQAEQLTLLRPLPSFSKDVPDGLAIEQTKLATLTTDDLGSFLKQRSWKLQNDHLPLRLLLFRCKDDYETLKLAKEEGASEKEVLYYKKHFHKGISEVFRRISSAFSVFCFTLVGIAFGIQSGRETSVKGIGIAVGFITIFLIFFFLARQVSDFYPLSATFYFGPEILILLFSAAHLSQINRGKGS